MTEVKNSWMDSDAIDEQKSQSEHPPSMTWHNGMEREGKSFRYFRNRKKYKKKYKKYHASIFMVLLQLGPADQLRNPEIYASPVGRTSSRQHRPQQKHTQERTCSLWQQMCGSCSYIWSINSIAKEATWYSWIRRGAQKTCRQAHSLNINIHNLYT